METVFQGLSVQWHCNCICNVNILFLLSRCNSLLCTYVYELKHYFLAMQFQEVLVRLQKIACWSEKNHRKLSVGLRRLTADSIFFFPEANDWWFGRNLSHPLRSCSLCLLFVMEKCEPAAPWRLGATWEPQAGHGSQGPSQKAGWLGAAPAPGTEHLPGDGSQSRLSLDMGPQVGLAWWSPWPGWARLWGTGEQPCCSVSGAVTEGAQRLIWGSGPWAGVQRGSQGGWARPVRTVSVLRILTKLTCTFTYK